MYITRARQEFHPGTRGDNGNGWKTGSRFEGTSNHCRHGREPVLTQFVQTWRTCRPFYRTIFPLYPWCIYTVRRRTLTHLRAFCSMLTRSLFPATHEISTAMSTHVITVARPDWALSRFTTHPRPGGQSCDCRIFAGHRGSVTESR